MFLEMAVSVASQAMLVAANVAAAAVAGFAGASAQQQTGSATALER